MSHELLVRTGGLGKVRGLVLKVRAMEEVGHHHQPSGDLWFVVGQEE